MRRYIPAFVAFIAFIFYRLTLAPSVLFIDSGELATVATNLGIAHPTGYPLFTLVGFVFAHLPLGGTPVFQLNLMAAVFCAMGAGVTTILTRFLLHRAGIREPTSATPRRKEKKSTFAPPVLSSELRERAELIASVFAGLMLAFSQTFWGQATAVEVYALHCVLVPLSIYFFVRYCDERPMKVFTRWGILWAVTWGLSFTNHMTTILLIPAFTWFFFRTFGWSARAFIRGVLLLLPFGAALTVYLFLPLRAAMQPAENWGNPVTVENFLRHWTGRQYTVWMFSSFDAAGKQFKYFMSDLPGEFGVLGLIPILTGGVALFRANRRLFTLVITLFATCVAYSINYDIHDIDSYFLLAYIAAAVLCGFGAWWMLTTKSLSRLALPLLAACVVVNMVAHYKENDDSRNYLVHDYALNVLNTLPPNAIMISWQWDFLISASIYFQQVEHVRPDVTVIDKELLRRTWYLDQIKHNFPALYERCRAQFEAFRVNLVKFERDEPYDPGEIEQQYVNVVHGLVETNLADHPVFCTQELEKEYTAGYRRIPEGLAYRLLPADDSLDLPVPQWTFRDIPLRNYYTDKIRQMYMLMAAERARYLGEKGKYAEAENFLTCALTFTPKTPGSSADIRAVNLNKMVQQVIALKEEYRAKAK